MQHEEERLGGQAREGVWGHDTCQVTTQQERYKLDLGYRGDPHTPFLTLLPCCSHLRSCCPQHPCCHPSPIHPHAASAPVEHPQLRVPLGVLPGTVTSKGQSCRAVARGATLPAVLRYLHQGAQGLHVGLLRVQQRHDDVFPHVLPGVERKTR